MNPLEALWGGIQRILGGTLAFFYDLVPNYGVAVILLTIALGLLLFPVTLKQTRSMRAMQEIQPEVKRIQKEHKGDREEMNKQLMALYQERGVNPAAGCLPLLIQGPIWFALFRVLQVNRVDGEPQFHNAIPQDSALIEALERGESTFLGMDLFLTPGEAMSIDIATGIPFLLLILVVVASGFYQTHQMMRRRKSEATADTPQSAQAESVQRAMRFMPLLIGVFAWGFPGGLVLYFAASNLFRVGQQAIILRDHQANPPKAALVEEPEPVEEAPKPKAPHPKSKKKKRKRK